MPCISANIILRPRKRRICPTCSKPIIGKTARLYGNAHQGDPPWVIYLHPECVGGKDSLSKLHAAEQRLQRDAAPPLSDAEVWQIDPRRNGAVSPNTPRP